MAVAIHRIRVFVFSLHRQTWIAEIFLTIIFKFYHQTRTILIVREMVSVVRTDARLLQFLQFIIKFEIRIQLYRI